MAINNNRIVIICVLLSLCISVDRGECQLRRPFPLGYGMGTLGAIQWGEGISSCQPWTPAVFYADSLRFGFSATGVDYYDPMDNLEDDRLLHGAIGGFYAINHLVIKGCWEELNAFGIYSEQTGYLSIGTNLIPIVSVSAELTGYRSGLIGRNEDPETLGEIGGSIWFKHSWAGLSVRLEHITIKKAHCEGFGDDPALTVGLHSSVNALGSQGVTCTAHFGTRNRINFCFAEEYRFIRQFGLHAALATNPFMIAFGAVVEWKGAGATVAFVNHPALGWSKGFELEYSHQ